MELFRENYRWEKPIRSLGVRVSDFDEDFVRQMDLFQKAQQQENQEKIERVVDGLRKRFGVFSIQRASLLKDQQLTGLDTSIQNQIHPMGFFSWNY